MVNDLTHFGHQLALHDDTRSVLTLNGSASGDGGIANIAANLGLFQDPGTSATVLDRDPATYNFATPSGGGYPGEIAITISNWTFSVQSNNGQVVLGNETFTAGAGGMTDVDGAFLADGSSPFNYLAWWQRSSNIDLNQNDTITADTLTIRIV